MSHPDASVTGRTGARAPAVVAMAALLGALAGVMLGYLTDVVSKSDIRGDGWSLRGNGALIMPVAGGPAVLAAGWTMLTLWWRADRAWVTAGMVAGILTLLASVLGVFAPILLVLRAPETAGIVQVVSVAAVSLPAVAAGIALAAQFGSVTQQGVLRGALMCLLTAATGVGLWGIFFVLAPFLVPVIVVTPLLAAATVGGATRPDSIAWLIGGFLALPISLIAGLYGASQILPA